MSVSKYVRKGEVVGTQWCDSSGHGRGLTKERGIGVGLFD